MAAMATDCLKLQVEMVSILSLVLVEMFMIKFRDLNSLYSALGKTSKTSRTTSRKCSKEDAVFVPTNVNKPFDNKPNMSSNMKMACIRSILSNFTFKYIKKI